MNFIDEVVEEAPINKMFISELHKILVHDLTPPPKGEGDYSPGSYRKINVSINKSEHTPPDYTRIDELMDELIEFINDNHSSKYDLLKAAIVHHRFLWIHPFSNGNGRAVRLLTYSMLVKLGFNVNIGRILNPTAVFCNDRDLYYKYLSMADSGTDEGVLDWCQYVLQGLKDEIEKIDSLLDYNFLKSTILIPAINNAKERESINEIEAVILKKVVELQSIHAADLKPIFKGKAPSEISRQIRKLIDKKLLAPEEEGKRSYVIRFDNNFLLRSIMKSLGENNFLPVKE